MSVHVTAKTILLLLGLFGSATASGKRTPNLPAELAGYRTWQASEVRTVSPLLSILCVALPEKELARRRLEAQRSYGPHAERYIRVLANQPAALASKDVTAQEYPVGSIIAKEKLAHPNATTADAVAFMIKRAPGLFPDSGGWEFRYYPESHGAKYSSCVECHRTGASKDYVFARLEGAAQQ